MNDSDVDQNIYSEWFYRDDKWERFGSSSLNLDGYYTKEEVETHIGKDWYIRAEEALEKGLVEEIITNINVLL